MPTNTYRGDAPATAQVTGWTFGGTWEADDVVKITINGKTLSVTTGSTVITTLLDTVVTAYNASTIPEFAKQTASKSGTTDFRLTADTPGEPFTAVLTSTEAGGGAADAQTIGAATVVTASKGPYHYDDPANWSLGAIPVNGDDVVFDLSSGSAYYGLAQSGVTLASLTCKPGWKGAIGLADYVGSGTSGYRQYLARYLATGATLVSIDCDSSQIRLDLGSVQSTVTVLSTGQAAAAGAFACTLKGTHASNVLNVLNGSVGVAVDSGDVSTLATIRQVNGTLKLGSGVTLTAVEKSGGTLELNSATTTFRQQDGAATIQTGAHASLIVDGGTVYLNTTGNIALVTVGTDGKLDLSQDIRAKTFTGLVTLLPRATLNDPYGVGDYQAGYKLSRCNTTEVTVNVGEDRTYSLS